MNCDISDDTIQVINFSTNNILASIDLKKLHKVIELPQISPITDGPSYIIGIIDFSGIIVPIIDLSMRIQNTIPTRYTLDTPILICNVSDNKKIGLIVRAVNGLSTVPKSSMEKYTLGHDNLFRAVIKYQSTISLLIDTDYVMKKHDKNIQLGDQ